MYLRRINYPSLKDMSHGGFYQFLIDNPIVFSVEDDLGQKLLTLFPNCLEIVNENIYNNYLEIEKSKNRILELKRLLTETDYKVLKYIDGLISEEEYLLIKEERNDWRLEINELEAKII
jgi:hypothetical protein